jgi:hypothetical protein
MHRRLRLTIAILVFASLCGCQRERGTGSGVAVGTDGADPAPAGAGVGVKAAGKHDPMTISREQLAALDEMTALLEKIQNDATAATVLPDLRKAAARLRAANEQMLALQADTKMSEAEATARFNDPAVQKQIEQVIDATGRMMDAQLSAQLKAPGKRGEIAAVCESANVRPKRKGPKTKG